MEMPNRVWRQITLDEVMLIILGRVVDSPTSIEPGHGLNATVLEIMDDGYNTKRDFKSDCINPS